MLERGEDARLGKEVQKKEDIGGGEEKQNKTGKQEEEKEMVAPEVIVCASRDKTVIMDSLSFLKNLRQGVHDTYKHV